MIDGKFNIGDLLKSFQNDKTLGNLLQKFKDEFVSMHIRVSGQSGAGLVEVVISEQGFQRRVEKISLADELLKEEKAVIEELIKAAFNDAERKAELERDEMKRKQMNTFNQTFDHEEESR